MSDLTFILYLVLVFVMMKSEKISVVIVSGLASVFLLCMELGK